MDYIEVILKKWGWAFDALNAADKKMSEINRWSQLRGISKSQAARATILIALIGYLIIFNSHISKYLSLVGSLDGSNTHSTIPVSPRLLVIYVGMVFITCGVALFAALCPREIKQYEKLTDYVAAMKPITINNDIPYMRHQLRMAFPNEKEWKRHDVEPYDYGVTLRRYYQMKDASYAPIRRTILIFYSVGFLLLLIPSFMVFLRILPLLWETFLIAIV